MGLVGDMVVQTANAPGTGDFVLIGPPAGRSSFMAQNGAGQVYYFAEDGTSWEKAIGTVTSGSPDGLSRDTVLGNSLGTTAKINFSGAVTIICDIPAERSLWANAAGDALLAGNRRVYGLGAAADPSDALRLDQVGNVRKPTIAVVNGAFLIPMPSLISGDTNQVVQIDLRSVVCAANTAYYFRLSIDGAASFLSGGSEYKYSLLTASDGGVAENRGVASYSPLTATLDHVSAMSGQLHFDPVTHQWNSVFVGVNAATGNYVQSFAAGSSATNVPPTHMIISAVSQNLTGGQARLSQKGF